MYVYMYMYIYICVCIYASTLYIYMYIDRLLADAADPNLVHIKIPMPSPSDVGGY